MHFRQSPSQRIGKWITNCFLAMVAFITLYPIIYVFSMSISAPDAVMRGKILLWPIGFSLGSYKMVFENSSVFQSYFNTLWYTAVGTTINVILTTCAAYALSRRTFFLRRAITVFITITMLFSGGMIPTFLVVSQLGLYNTRWAIILPTAVVAYNMIVARTYFQSSIPDSLPESAKIDGCTDIGVLLRIVLPISKPILAVLLLFYAISHWNNYFTAILYLSKPELQPLQVFLRKVLILNERDLMTGVESSVDRLAYMMQLKYATIMISIIPIICVYPFLQKYFVQGVMLGSIKE